MRPTIGLESSVPPAQSEVDVLKHRVTTGLISVLGVAAFAEAQGGNPPAGGQSAPPVAVVDVSRLGPQMGEVVPPFALPDHTGVTRTLKDLLGPKGALLVFSRSADW